MQTFFKPLLPVLLAPLLLTSCGGGDEIIASCMNMQMSDESRVCIDAAASDREMMQGICRIGKGDWDREARCDQSSAIAGCRKQSGTVMWMYRSARVTSVRSVEKACDDGELLLPGEQ